MTDFQILRNEIQIFRNEIQARRNKFQIRRNEIQIQNSSLPFLELSLFNDLRGPSTHGARPQMGRPSCEPGVSPGHPRDFRRRGPTQGVRRIRQSFVLSIVASDCCDMTARMAGTSPRTVRPSDLGIFVVPSFVSGSSDLSKVVKGWRHFTIADAWAPFPPDSVGRGASSRKRESWVHGSPGHEPGDRGPRGKDGRSIRRPAEIRPLETSPIRFRA